jgi:subtilisin family serine protease
MRLPALLLAALAVGLVPATGFAAPAARLDPRLTSATQPGARPVAVWVEFGDKGEAGPRDLAERLGAAERALTPDARRRREKAHVSPIVDWLDLPIEPAYVRALSDAGYDVYGQSRWFNRVAVHAAGEQLLRLEQLPFVRVVTPVELAEPRARQPELVAEPARDFAAPARASLPTAAQVLYGQTLTQLARLNVQAVHDSGYIGTAINVCLLDDGFNWYRKHEVLKNIPVGIGRTRDFVRGIASVQDTESVEAANFMHGTATLSVLAGRKAGVYIAPAWGCNVVLGRTEDSGSEQPIEMVYWGMGAEWADSLGCDIISSSLGYNVFDTPGSDITYPMLDGHTAVVTRAAEIAAAKGMLVVVSGGNDGFNARVGRKIGAPADANGDSVLAIGAMDSLGVRAGFSSKGPTFDGRLKPDLAAQGVQVLTAFPSSNPNLYTRQSGTSFSAPLVAGLAACLMQARPSWPPTLIIEALKRTASKAANPDTLLGYGAPDGLAALRYVPDTLHVPDHSLPLSLRFAGPNPLHRSGPPGAVRISLAELTPAVHYRVRVLDAAGRLMRELASGTLSPGGSLFIPWQGDDAHGRALVPGLYFLALEGAGRRDAVRIVVLP